jgi:hypothetical protein
MVAMGDFYFHDTPQALAVKSVMFGIRAHLLNMHAARTAPNRDPELRQWVEQCLKSKERTVAGTMSDDEFESTGSTFG